MHVFYGPSPQVYRVIALFVYPCPVLPLFQQIVCRFPKTFGLFLTPFPPSLRTSYIGEPPNTHKHLRRTYLSRARRGNLRVSKIVRDRERECLDSTRRIFARHLREVCANAEGSLEYTHSYTVCIDARARARTEYDTDWPLDDVLNIYDKYGATCSLFGRGGKLIISV